jgi:hypothetical protein
MAIIRRISSVLLPQEDFFVDAFDDDEPEAIPDSRVMNRFISHRNPRLGGAANLPRMNTTI